LTLSSLEHELEHGHELALFLAVALPLPRDVTKAERLCGGGKRTA
jgi:hypothetical protein